MNAIAAINLRVELQKLCPRLGFTVYADYHPTETKEEAYWIIANHPKTNEILIRRRVSVRELMSEEGSNLLMAQLFLIEPPT